MPGLAVYIRRLRVLQIRFRCFARKIHGPDALPRGRFNQVRQATHSCLSRTRLEPAAAHVFQAGTAHFQPRDQRAQFEKFPGRKQLATGAGANKAGRFRDHPFGNNDENKTNLARFTEPYGRFKQNLELYVRETRERKGIPILATPVARRRFSNNGQARESHQDYADAVRQVATETRVPLSDMDKRSLELLSHWGPERSKQFYDWFEPGDLENLPHGLEDNSHFNAFGASRICDLAVVEIRAAAPDLAVWLVK